ncbi:MAG: hypothetical protein FJ388_13260 [Verrucomicrobia bacterium]|nr:hypothetical protein [Verrucomicrobiota bacterium]
MTERAWKLAPLILSLLTCSISSTSRAAADPWTLDFRYAPPDWQTSICLPDDSQKTLVGKDGTLLYDYPGSLGGFGTRILAGVAGETNWVRQELASPRVPIVRTVKRSGDVEIVEEAFAVPASASAAKETRKAGFIIERVGEDSGQPDWAKPSEGSDPAFRHIAIGWKKPIHYRFKAAKGERYTVALGLCEGWHDKPGQRILDLKVEGAPGQTVDPVAAARRNVPQVLRFDARDENGDGWIDIEVAPAKDSRDKNTILNLLWVFREGDAAANELLLAGQSPKAPLARVECGMVKLSNLPPHHEALIVRARNRGQTEAKIVPTLAIASAYPISPSEDRKRVTIGAQTTVVCPQPFEGADKLPHKVVLRFEETTILPGKEVTLAFGVGRGRDATAIPRDVAHAESLRRQAETFWRKSDLPYGAIEVPDVAVQALLESCIRNIYQAREIKKGLPAFQVGPTCYRGLWVVDGSFIMESVAYLGRLNEARRGIEYLLSFQRDDGAFMLIDGHWKETGIALWAVTRHARLTRDKKWLREVWPKVERGFAFIRQMRAMPAAGAPNARLVPDGFSDGGLAGRTPEYTNIYWTMAGMRAAVEGARWLGETATAADWQREYDDFYQTFRRAAERDMRTDAHGNRCLPIRMTDPDNVPVQKAQWAFLHAVFPGKIFAADDPLLRGNMAMLRAVESEGLVFDTGWLKEGLWNYFGSFYAHAWLWLGDGDKAARTLYAFGNHASPLHCWREEHKPRGQGSEKVGDMPHNWASAEFIRLVRHALALERGDDLHLFEALPAKWARPGAVTRLRDIATEFGPLSLDLRVSAAGASAHLRLQPPRRTLPRRIVLHLDNWSGQKGSVELPIEDRVEQKIDLSLKQ